MVNVPVKMISPSAGSLLIALIDAEERIFNELGGFSILWFRTAADRAVCFPSQTEWIRRREKMKTSFLFIFDWYFTILFIWFLQKPTWRTLEKWEMERKSFFFRLRPPQNFQNCLAPKLACEQLHKSLKPNCSPTSWCFLG